jgi:hypothetical protein
VCVYIHYVLCVIYVVIYTKQGYCFGKVEILKIEESHFHTRKFP